MTNGKENYLHIKRSDEIKYRRKKANSSEWNRRKTIFLRRFFFFTIIAKIYAVWIESSVVWTAHPKIDKGKGASGREREKKQSSSWMILYIASSFMCSLVLANTTNNNTKLNQHTKRRRSKKKHRPRSITPTEVAAVIVEIFKRVRRIQSKHFHWTWHDLVNALACGFVFTLDYTFRSLRSLVFSLIITP